MNANGCLAVIAGLGLLAAADTVGAPAPPASSRNPAAAATVTTIAKARSAARANAATPLGRDWKQRHETAVGVALIPVLNKCLPEDAEEVTAFTIFVRLGQRGRVLEVVTELSPELGACMTAGAAAAQVPQPPRDDYWLQLNLAAEL